jgi:hypothetical protein
MRTPMGRRDEDGQRADRTQLYDGGQARDGSQADKQEFLSGGKREAAGRSPPSGVFVARLIRHRETADMRTAMGRTVTKTGSVRTGT